MTSRENDLLRGIVTLLCLRPFGNIIHDIAGKYEKKVSISDLRKFEKTSIKVGKAEFDLNTPIPEKTGSCMQARLNSPRAFKMANEMLRRNEEIGMYEG